jgi:surface protein
MFEKCAVFNQDISSWNTSNNTNMGSMFEGCQAFNQNLSQWKTDKVIRMSSMFNGCTSFNQDLSSWNTSNITNMYYMFKDCSVFNQDLSNWNTANVIYMSRMFEGCTNFNQDLSSWNTENVINMEAMFIGCKAFNQDLSNWNITNVTVMDLMFNGCTNFNQDLSSWNITNVISMYSMLSYSGLSLENYDNTLIGWSAQNVQSNVSLGATDLKYCEATNQRQALINAKGWVITGDEANADDCSSTLSMAITIKTDNAGSSNSTSFTIPTNSAYTYNYDVDWDNDGTFDEFGLTGNSTHDYSTAGTYTIAIQGTFPHIYFNSGGDKEKLLSIDKWGTIFWANMNNAFAGCSNLSISATDTPFLLGVTNMDSTFLNCISLNNDIGSWTTANVTSMRSTFSGCSLFNIDLDSWNTANVKAMDNMFQNCVVFNQDLENWNTANVTSMSSLFSGCSVFNGNISNWSVDRVAMADNMFLNCTAFNQNLSTWITDSISTMSSMFKGCTAFDQDLGSWNITSVSNMSNMLDNTALSVANYDNTLIEWSAQAVKNNVALGANGLNYCSSTDQRQSLLDTYEWSISGDTENCPEIPFLTTWKTDNVGTSNSTSVTIPTNPAYTYNYDVDWDNDGTFDEIGITGDVTHTFTTAGEYTIGIQGTFPHIYFNNGGDNEKLLSIDQWGTIAWYDMTNAFAGCSSMIYAATDIPQLFELSSMSNAFAGCISFNGDINSWNTSSINLMDSLFFNCVAFDQSLENWNTSNVTTMSSMFSGASVFNGEISSWNTENVISMDSMFTNCTVFNQDISTWNTVNVSNMNAMFKNCEAFNGDPGLWNTANVSFMSNMFQECLVFNQNLEAWDVRLVTDMNGMLDNTFLSVSNYDSTLIGWAKQSVQNNVPLGANGLVYCGAKSERQALIDNYSWTITGDTENSTSGIDTQVACGTYTWIDGSTYTASNNMATYTIPNVGGCDSLVTLDLTIVECSEGIDTHTSCDCYTWMDGNIYSENNTTATYNLTNAMGCDSVVTLDLTINYSSISTDTYAVCDSFTWIDGITYTESNYTATHTLASSTGCDSMLILDLTIGNNTGIDVQMACDNYTWIDGITYTENNYTATDTLTNIAGCDSVVTLNLTLSNEGTDTQMVCDSLTWIDGITYYESNTEATYTLTSSLGCDSVVTLNLTINHANSGSDIQSACNSYTWIDGITYTEDNNSAMVTLQNENGCDSVVTLNLTIHTGNTGTDTQSACNSFTWIDGITYTEDNNSAMFTLQNEYGCDSLVTLDLTINTLNTSTTVNDLTITADEHDATYAWINCDGDHIIDGETAQSFTAKENGDYGVIISKNECVDTSECVAITTIAIVENTFTNSFQLYPNPTDRIVFIDFDVVYDEIQISIRSIDGKLFSNETYTHTKAIKFELEEEPGVYFMEISAGQEKAIVKVVKK